MSPHIYFLRPQWEERKCFLKFLDYLKNPKTSASKLKRSSFGISGCKADQVVKNFGTLTVVTILETLLRTILKVKVEASFSKNNKITNFEKMPYLISFVPRSFRVYILVSNYFIFRRKNWQKIVPIVFLESEYIISI